MIGILIIATRKYKQFVVPLIRQIDEKFLVNYKKTIFIFSDEPMEIESKSKIHIIHIPSYSWPYPTLMRYRIFCDAEFWLKKCSYLFYLDVDMAVVGEVGDEILVDGLMAVRHPGFWATDGWGDSNNPETSSSYMPPEKRKHYYCGGTQGGTAEAYLEMSRILAANIDSDEMKGVRAIHNDETHYNKYVNENFGIIPMKELTPSYCMPEQEHFQRDWGLSELPIKIIALSKNHEQIRS